MFNSFNAFEQFQLFSFNGISQIGYYSTIALIAYVFFYFYIFSDNVESNKGSISFLPSSIKPVFLPKNRGLGQYLFEYSYKFLYFLILTYVTKRAFNYFPIISVVFLFIFSLNYIGLIPFSFTVTSHVATTAGLGFTIFVGIQIIGVIIQKAKFFQIFLPSGIPIWLFSSIPVIEMFIYFSRVLSLSLRLIANMTSGHLLTHIFASFGAQLFNGWLIFVYPVLFIFLVGLTGLESIICFIQAYVFAILTSLYLADVVNNSH